MKNKSRKVGMISHEKSGIEIEYFINGTQFECTVLEEKLTASEASVLRHMVVDKLEHWMNLEWFPIMEITCEEKKYDSYRNEGPDIEAGIQLGARRYWLSRSPAGNVVRVDWDVDEEHRKAKMENFGQKDLKLTRLPLKAPFQRNSSRWSSGSQEWMIDYTKEKWDTVTRMIEAIQQMHSQMAKLFKSREGIAKLESVGLKLLGPGKK
jgi:hypothetical protein